MKNNRIYPWILVGLLWGVALLNYMDRQMLSTMKEAMQVDISALESAENFGRLMAVFLWIYGFMSPVAGMIADRLNRKWLIVGSLFVWSAVTYGMGYAETFTQLYWLRAVMGISEALYIPAGRHVAVLLSILAAMIMTVIGMQKGFGGVKWGIDDVSAVFLASALFSGIVGKLHPSEIANSFVKGAGGAVGGALVIGFARGVYWVMNSANINATIVYNATQLLKGLPPLAAAIGIVILVSFINGLIPSGSGKGALLAPIIVPIAMELGLTSQTAVLAYQFGDGITNMFWFSYGTLMIFLNYAKVPVQKWYKFFLPLMAIYFLFAFVSMGVAIAIGF